MANLLDISYITGHKSISDMTDSELLEHLKKIRSSRRETKAYDAKTTEAQPKQSKPRTKKTQEQIDLGKSMKALSQEQLLELISRLESENE